MRHGRLARRSTAAAVVVALVVGLLVVVRGGSSRSLRTAASAPTTSAKPQPQPSAIVSAPEPKGWRLVDYGDARLAFPPGWTTAAITGTSPAPCATISGAAIRFYLPAPNCPTVTIAPLGATTLPPRPAATIHGFRVYLAADSVVSLTYAVPALHVEITLHDHAATPVLGTLTSSARRVVLGGGALPTVPGAWKSLTFGGITVRVPPTMPVTHLASNHLAPGECSASPFRVSGAFVGNGVDGPISCPMILAGLVPTPTDGVWLHTIGVGLAAPHWTRTIDNGHARLSIAPVPLFGPSQLAQAIDVAIIGTAGGRSTTVVRIGLGADPQIARTILASIEPSN